MSLTAWHKSVPQETRPGQVPPRSRSPNRPSLLARPAFTLDFGPFSTTRPRLSYQLIRYSPQAVSLSHSDVSKPSHYFSLADFEQACATLEN